MTHEAGVTFQALLTKAQTLKSDGYRITLDLPTVEIDAFKALLPLIENCTVQVAIVPIPEEFNG